MVNSKSSSLSLSLQLSLHLDCPASIGYPVLTGETMRIAARENRNGSEVLVLDRDGLLRLIDDEAERVGVSGSEAIRLIKQGRTGNNYVWDHLSLLVGMLR